MTQLSLSNVGVEYGATPVLRDVTVTIDAGERWGIIGRNGSGKTSLFRILMGRQAPSSGSMARTPNLRFAELDQHREFAGATTVWDAAADAFRHLIALEDQLAEQGQALSDAGDASTDAQLQKYARDLERFQHAGGYTWRSAVDAVLSGLGFDPRDARTRPLAQLSGGERGRVALARQLAIPADVLLLDEPTNHLDLETTRWLEEFLRSSRETQLIISHDRAFLDRVVDHVLHLEDGTACAYACGYAEFVQQRGERRLSQQRAFDRQSRVVAREEDYIRRNIAGQNTRQAKGRRKRLSSLPRLTPPPEDDSTMHVRFEASERGGDQVVVFDAASVRVGERVLLSPFNGWIRRGDVVGLIGPNGTGKTTLLRALAGESPVASGSIRVGGAIQPAVYTQDFSNVPRTKSVFDVIADMRPMWERGAVMGHLGRVQFSGDETGRSTGSLSGGELARVALAMMMLDGANFLVFDEPTNHLDVESIEALEDAIEAFGGTVLLVSHDRELLRKLVTRVWELRDGTLKVFDGDFGEWEIAAERAEAVAKEAEEQRQATQRAREKESERRGSVVPQMAARARRDAQRAVDRTEAEVHELDARVQSLEAELGASELYATSSGIERANVLARSLEDARGGLARAVADWERALETLEGLVAESSNPARRPE